MFGVIPLADGIAILNRLFGLQLAERWDSSISASIVLMIFVFFLLAWVFSPRYGLLSTMIRRANRRRRFADQVVLAHIHNHQHTALHSIECRMDTLHGHFRWRPGKMQRVMARLRALGYVRVVAGIAELTERGERQVHAFRRSMLEARNMPDLG